MDRGGAAQQMIPRVKAENSVPGRPGFLIQTLGCKVNQFDAASLAQALEEAGLQPVHGGRPPDLVVVQTCTVTSATDRQNRRVIRSLRYRYPRAMLVATGCQAEAFRESLEGMPEVDLVWGTRHRDGLLEQVLERLGLGGGGVSGRDVLWGEGLAGLPGRTRAFLKVQDGCNGGCSYCIVPRARGRSRSRPLASVSRALELMEGAGVQEVVLTGVHLGSYGRDLSPASCLCELLDRVLEGCSIPRIRLSSIEPQELEQGLIDRLAREPRLCPHLHVPLQSGADELLRLMRRPYDRAHYRERVLAAAQAIGDLTWGADLIVGFPGETEEHFLETWRFLDSIPWTYLHVFPFSARPGTLAHNMGPRVPPQETKRRASILRDLSRQRRLEAMASRVDRTLPVLLERPLKGRPGWMEGLSHNYFRVAVRAPQEFRNRVVEVRVQSIGEGILTGVLEQGPICA